MIKNIITNLITGAFAVVASTSFGAGNELYSGADGNGNGIGLETQLRIDISKDTDVVKIDRDDTSEALLTKAFVLKNADPYEIRPYIRNMVKACEFGENEENSHVECAKYEDGTGILIVTAEEKKFEQGVNGGLSVVELINRLDKPSITSSSGQKKFIHFARHESAEALQEVLDTVYLQSKTSSDDAAKKAELEFPKEKTAIDYELNALVVYANPYNIDKAKAALNDIDKQGSNNHLKVTVYELDETADAEIGHDFQAWKNANYDKLLSYNDPHLVVSGGYSSEHLDFLMEKGAAKIHTQGELVLADGKSGQIGTTNNDYKDLIVRDIEETDLNGIDKDNNDLEDAPKREARVNQDAIGFYTKLKPRQVGSTTMLDIHVKNTSVVGFEQNGTLKSSTAEINTEVVIDNNVKKYVIGGIEKKEITAVVNKVPFLGSIPGLGWLFTQEGTETKTSQLVVVVESERVMNNWGVHSDAQEAISRINEETGDAGKEIKVGTEQYLLDEDKNFSEDMDDAAKKLSGDTAKFMESL